MMLLMVFIQEVANFPSDASGLDNCNFQESMIEFFRSQSTHPENCYADYASRNDLNEIINHKNNLYSSSPCDPFSSNPMRCRNAFNLQDWASKQYHGFASPPSVETGGLNEKTSNRYYYANFWTIAEGPHYSDDEYYFPFFDDSLHPSKGSTFIYDAARNTPSYDFDSFYQLDQIEGRIDTQVNINTESESEATVIYQGPQYKVVCPPLNVRLRLSGDTQINRFLSMMALGPSPFSVYSGSDGYHPLYPTKNSPYTFLPAGSSDNHFPTNCSGNANCWKNDVFDFMLRDADPSNILQTFYRPDTDGSNNSVAFWSGFSPNNLRTRRLHVRLSSADYQNLTEFFTMDSHSILFYLPRRPENENIYNTLSFAMKSDTAPQVKYIFLDDQNQNNQYLYNLLSDAPTQTADFSLTGEYTGELFTYETQGSQGYYYGRFIHPEIVKNAKYKVKIICELQHNNQPVQIDEPKGTFQIEIPVQTSLPNNYGWVSVDSIDPGLSYKCFAVVSFASLQPPGECEDFDQQNLIVHGFDDIKCYANYVYVLQPQFDRWINIMPIHLNWRVVNPQIYSVQYLSDHFHPFDPDPTQSDSWFFISQQGNQLYLENHLFVPVQVTYDNYQGIVPAASYDENGQINPGTLNINYIPSSLTVSVQVCDGTFTQTLPLTNNVDLSAQADEVSCHEENGQLYVHYRGQITFDGVDQARYKVELFKNNDEQAFYEEEGDAIADPTTHTAVIEGDAEVNELPGFQIKLRITADPDDEIQESDENNNVAETHGICGVCAFIPDENTITPDGSYILTLAGQPLEQGTLAYNTNLINIEQIGGGMYHIQYNVSGKGREGMATITYTLNSGGSCQAVVHLERPTLPDLEAQRIDADGNWWTGKTVLITGHFREATGEFPIEDSFNVELIVQNESGDIVARETETYDGMDAGRSDSISLSYTPTKSGEYTITLSVDSEDDIEESDETNNEMQITKTAGEVSCQINGGCVPPGGIARYISYTTEEIMNAFTASWSVDSPFQIEASGIGNDNRGGANPKGSSSPYWWVDIRGPSYHATGDLILTITDGSYSVDCQKTIEVCDECLLYI